MGWKRGEMEESYFLAGKNPKNSAAGTRARSASPLCRSQQRLPHHLFNDFIQLPLAGTYRHMDTVYGSGVEGEILVIALASILQAPYS